MIFFIWSRWGILVLVYAFAALLVGTLIGTAISGGYLVSQLVFGVCELIVAAAIWFTGVRLNRDTDQELVDPKTGRRVVLRRRHTLFWIPMQYWAPVVALLGVVAVVAGFVRR